MRISRAKTVIIPIFLSKAKISQKEVIHGLFEPYRRRRLWAVPGLGFWMLRNVSGAHLNKGLGLSFLKHIRQCTSLVFVLDVSVPSYLKQLDYLKHELEQYQPGLSSVPSMIVANKTDTVEGAHNLNHLIRKIAAKGGAEVVGVSALYQLNIDTLINKLRTLHLSQQSIGKWRQLESGIYLNWNCKIAECNWRSKDVNWFSLEYQLMVVTTNRCEHL